MALRAQVNELHSEFTKLNHIVNTHLNKESPIWVGFIQENRKAVQHLSERLIALEHEPTSRPDPFTGTQDKELERRIQQLESK